MQWLKVDSSGKILYSGIQGGSGTNGVALCAYATIAFIEDAQNSKSENGSREKDHSTPISRPPEFIVNKTNDESIEDPYAIVITIYALYLANHSAKNEYFDRMEKLAKTQEGFK